MNFMRVASLAAALAAFCLVALPAAGSASTQPAKQSAANKVRAQTKNCAPIAKSVKTRSGNAKRAAQRRLSDCKKQNQARKIAARQIAGYGLVGTRGDGQYVDWRHCSNGSWVHYTDGSYGRSVSKGKSWRITHAIVRQGGKWFDAVLSQPVKGGRMEVGIARRGQKWQVAIASFSTQLSSYGDVKRSKVSSRDCVAA